MSPTSRSYTLVTMRILITGVIQIGLGLPVVLISLPALIVHECVHTSAYALPVIKLSNPHGRHSNRLGQQHPYPFHCLLMSTDPLIANDSNDHHITVLVGSKGSNLHVTWEREVANDILQRANDAIQSDGRPYMVAIAGMPGSGKSSSAEIITHLINQEMSSQNENDICVCIPADGYHYSVATLQELQIQRNDPTLIYRRGAPDTFDVTALRHDLECIRYPDRRHIINEQQQGSSGSGTTTRMVDPSSSVDRLVRLPGFDHAVGDPTTHQHVYDRSQHSILLMEGLYLLYDQNEWDLVKDYFDHTIYIQTHSIDTCMDRVKERNVCIPGYTVAEIYERVDRVDRNNAILIDQASPSRAHQVIRSSSL